MKVPTQGLLRLLTVMTPVEARVHLASMMNEIEYVPDRDRTAWRLAAVATWLRAVFGALTANRVAWSALVAGGALAGGLDVRLATRLPYVVAMMLFSAALCAQWPVRSWRWIVTLPLVLPVQVWLTGNWGPYQFDRLDAFYGIVPALAGGWFGGWVGRRERRPHAIAE
jgi:hypothetical protein